MSQPGCRAVSCRTPTTNTPLSSPWRLCKRDDCAPPDYPRSSGTILCSSATAFLCASPTHSGGPYAVSISCVRKTDKSRMALLGNFFTRYRYVRTGVRVNAAGNRFTAADPQTGLHISADLADDAPPSLPKTSPFPDWKTARRFCGPMPYTFSMDETRNRAVLVKGRRTNWQPRAVHVRQHHVPWLDIAGYSHARLASAFVVRDVPYFWERGRSEPLP